VSVFAVDHLGLWRLFTDVGLSLDIGGTSTDVSRYSGRYEITYETTTAGISIQSPQLNINTVAAGGGSCLTFSNGLFKAGPESAGAHPGPACYRLAL
jgi:5-oxoprolinase (ATP-hydrolysing)